MWSEEGFSFAGKHYTIREVPKAAKLPAGERPTILVGGGGKRLLSVAGRYADIVGINPSLPEGKITRDDAGRPRAGARAREGRLGARRRREGRPRPDAIELQSLIFVLAITDDPSGLREALAGNSGMSARAGRRLPALPDRLRRRDPGSPREATRGDRHLVRGDPGRATWSRSSASRRR